MNKVLGSIKKRPTLGGSNGDNNGNNNNTGGGGGAGGGEGASPSGPQYCRPRRDNGRETDPLALAHNTGTTTSQPQVDVVSGSPEDIADRCVV